MSSQHWPTTTDIGYPSWPRPNGVPGVTEGDAPALLRIRTRSPAACQKTIRLAAPLSPHRSPLAARLLHGRALGTATRVGCRLGQGSARARGAQGRRAARPSSRAIRRGLPRRGFLCVPAPRPRPPRGAQRNSSAAGTRRAPTPPGSSTTACHPTWSSGSWDTNGHRQRWTSTPLYTRRTDNADRILRALTDEDDGAMHWRSDHAAPPSLRMHTRSRTKVPARSAPD